MSLKPFDFEGFFSARRIVVVDANGAGKTWLSNRLGSALDLPVTHNDALALTTRWAYRTRPETERMRDAVAQAAQKIIEGGPSVLRGSVFLSAQDERYRADRSSACLVYGRN